MNHTLINNLLVVIGTVTMLLIVFNPKLMKSRLWRATITPLASIIGSGFLILGPILDRDYGIWSIAVMGGLCAAAWAIGSAIRFNILEYDRVHSAEGSFASLPAGTRSVETLASWALVIAYVISVTYYINLFGAFAVRMTPTNSVGAARLVATGALAFIGYFGVVRGLASLENMEEVTVGLKLSIIAGLLVGMVAYAMELSQTSGLEISPLRIEGFRAVAVAFGLVITVQGFETSRYLVDEYDAPTCVRTMKYAQWISTAIYMVYIALATLSFDSSGIEASETAIIDMTRVVAPLLPALLVVAALASQFSAAVADTSASGGLVQELSRKRISSNTAYGLLVAGAIAITWLANIFEIIALASRAFAVYYFLQTLIAIRFSWAQKKYVRTGWFAIVALLCLAIVLFGIPAEG